MSDTFHRIVALIERGEVKTSQHGYRRLDEHGLLIAEVYRGIRGGVVVEDFPEYYAGPAVLVRQPDARGGALHVLWGIPAGAPGPAVLITVYRPDSRLWDEDYLKRR